jgi:hypothetical protein
MPDQMGGLAATDGYPLDEQQMVQDAFAAAAARTQRQVSALPEPGTSPLGQAVQQFVSQPSWLEKAQAESEKNAAALQQGGLPAMLARDPTQAIELSGGFGGVTKGPKLPKVEPGLAGFAPGSTFDPSIYANPKLAAKAEALRGKYPQYAESYPETGPPALRAKRPDPDNPGKFFSTNPIKGEVPYASMEEALAKDAEPGFFLEKKLTPEAEQFQKDRAIIQQHLTENGYRPYFDPAKRFDVNPKHYGPFEDTSIEAAPATAKTDAEWYAKYGTPENRAKLQAGFKEGQGVPESDRWYYMGQLEKAYIDELGVKAGREAFKREFADMMAATTGGAAPYENNLMSHYANFMAKRGERLPERGYELPFPIGGRFASGNLAQAQKYIDEGMVGFSAEQNPKRYDFSSAFQGNKNAATIDEQMYGALRPTTSKGTENVPQWYGPATRVAREEAAAAGVDPRGFQDVGWAGLKKGKTEAAGKTFEYEGPMINHPNLSIETTSWLTGMPRAEVVRRGLIRKEIPMYTRGIPSMGSLAAQDDYQQ